MGPQDFGLRSPADYGYTEFKNDVHVAMNDYFGKEHVTRGNKALDIKENTYRIAADVVPCFEHRRYQTDGAWIEPEGTAFYPDNGGRIINWPKQNYANGVTKNANTSQCFKSLVRIFKRVCNKMRDENIDAAKPMSSFLLESLVWNVPDPTFAGTYSEMVRASIIHLYNATKQFESCKELGEVNDLKYLFASSQPWKYGQVNTFLGAMWSYLEFK